MNKKISYPFVIAALYVLVSYCMQSCAVMIPPSGGPKDTLPPRLMLALPKDSSINFASNKVTLTFDEFVEVKDAQKNLIVSPNPKNTPDVEYKLRNVTVKLKDSLQSNTTYTLNFGNAIQDVNEGNIAKNFSYVFSTGKYIDSGVIKGKVLLAETGKTDSTLIVVLHQNLADSAVEKEKPRYYTLVDAKGNFGFTNLPMKKFAIYVLPNDYNKRYDDSTKLFAFSDTNIIVKSFAAPITLYAFEEAKKKEVTKAVAAPAVAKNKLAKKVDTQIKLLLELDNGKQDLLNPLSIQINRKMKKIDTSKFILCDTGFHKLSNYTVVADTSHPLTKVYINYTWKEDLLLKIIVAKDAVADSLGTTLTKADTLFFTTKRESDYGSLRFRFLNIDTLKNQVLQIISDNKIVDAIKITQKEYYRKLYKPGEYELKLLYDKNKNGKWDTGNFKHKLQPEIVKDLNKKITIKQDWDNEFDVAL